MFSGTVLIIDDEDKLRSLLARILSLEGFSVTEAATGKAGLKKLEHDEFQVVLCDVKLPDINGIELTQKIKSLYPSTEVIVLTAYGTIADGVKAIKHGAFDYITKGDDNDKIIPLVNRAIEKAKLQNRIHNLEIQIGNKYSFESIIGISTQFKEVISLARKVSATDTTVLLSGETGTGKEVFAQAIHYNGKRQNKNFVAVNCSALGKEILESELFGYKAGAFTGATKDKKGLFEEATEGTIFLDEISEMDITLQAKLLRVLETSEFIKVGDTKPTKVNVRIIAATNRDLENEVENATFRSDLYYRLAVFQLHLPSLRNRIKDIEPLAIHFLRLFSEKVNKPVPEMTPGFIEKLKTYQWKGNIRELKNVIERAVILTDTNQLTTDNLPADILLLHTTTASALDLASIEKQHILKILTLTKGNKTEAARLLNIGLTTLYRKLEEYKIS